MAFTVDFHIFSKRENSTKRPPDTGLSLQCELKDDCGVMNPVIRILKTSGINPPLYNYAHIPSFSRYYFVTEWTWSDGLWSASLQVDPLASWKTYIGNSEQYVLRSSADFDGDILDAYYPTKGGKVQIVEDVADGFEYFVSYGRYVIGIINSDDTAIGAVSYYVFTQAQFNALREYLMSDTGWLSVDAAALDDAVLRAVFNPFQYIVSCKWFPFASVPTSGSVSSVKFGWWTVPISCYRASEGLWSDAEKEITIPKHPDTWNIEAGYNYLNLAPYSEYVLYMSPWGMIPIDSTRIYDSPTLYVTRSIDCITGVGILHISKGSNYDDDVIAILTAQVGIDIQLAQISRDYLGTASTAATAAGSVISNAMSLNIGGAIASAATGIEATIKSAAPQLMTSGGNGSRALYTESAKLIGTFFHVVDMDNENHGRPLCKVCQLSSFPGYLLILDADIAAPATAEENRAIKGYMEAGFFYE